MWLLIQIKSEFWDDLFGKKPKNKYKKFKNMKIQKIIDLEIKKIIFKIFLIRSKIHYQNKISKI